MSEMSETEQEARSQGWVPKEEYRGNPDNWVDAEKFVERGEKIAAIANDKAKRLEATVEELKAAREADKQTFAEFKQFQDEIRERDKEALENWYQDQLSAIRQNKKEALEKDDHAAVLELDDRKDALKDKYHEEKEKLHKEKKSDVKTTAEDDPVFKSWLKENQWYKDDEDMQAYANGYGATLQGKFAGKEFLDKVAEKVRQVFPDKFENPNREKANTVEGAGGGRRKQGKTYDDLPAHAKKACDKFCETIPGYTKEQYLKEVDWDAIMKEAENG